MSALKDARPPVQATGSSSTLQTPLEPMGGTCNLTYALQRMMAVSHHGDDGGGRVTEANSVAQSARATLALALFAFMDERGVPYVVVGDVRNYQRSVESDIDIVVSDGALPDVPRLLTEFAETHSGRLVQAVRHESTAFYFVLAHHVNGAHVYLHPDVCGAYIRRGRHFLGSDELLRDRRRSPEGFAVPAPDRAFGYYLLKKIDKGSLDRHAFGYLLGLWHIDREGCRAWIAHRLPERVADALAAAFDQCALTEVIATLPALRSAVERSTPMRLDDRVAEVRRVADRLARPTGIWIVLYGPDGAGKSSVVDVIEDRLAPAFRRSRRYHLRPQFVRRTASRGAPVTCPHAQPPRGWLASVTKAAYWSLDAVAGYWLSIRWQLVRSTLVIFDRYVDDLAVDPRRYRYGGPAWAVELVHRAAPRPHMTVILDASADVLQVRKAEVSPEESERQRAAYRALAERSQHAVIINAAAPLEDVVQEVESAVLRHLEARTRRRMGLA